jgi:hypothetical protein
MVLADRGPHLFGQHRSQTASSAPHLAQLVRQGQPIATGKGRNVRYTLSVSVSEVAGGPRVVEQGHLVKCRRTVSAPPLKRTSSGKRCAIAGERTNGSCEMHLALWVYTQERARGNCCRPSVGSLRLSGAARAMKNEEMGSRSHRFATVNQEIEKELTAIGLKATSDEPWMGGGTRSPSELCRIAVARGGFLSTR